MGDLPIGVHSPGHVADTDEQAREELWPHYEAMYSRIGRERGWGPTTRGQFEAEADGGALYVGSPETVARKIGMPIEQVWKTLVCRGDGKEIGFAVLAGDAELDLKAYARVAGHKSAEVVALKEVQPLTGYVRGGVTVFGAKKEYPVYVDETIELFDVVSVSAGARGTQILIAPADYLHATGGKVGPIARPKD